MQVPADPVRAHDLQGPSQADAQQTPCAQKPLAQLLPPVHGGQPIGPTQKPLRHTPIVHSGSAVQNSAQRFPAALHR